MIKKMLFAVLLLVSQFVQAQLRVKELFVQAPDSIFPFLTSNNKLDCIDLIENKRKAEVKNLLEQSVILQRLTDTHLRIQTSAKSSVEMLLLSDSLCCLIRTCLGPAADSQIKFYTAQWKPVAVPLARPAVSEFWTAVPDSLQQDAHSAQRSLQDLPLMEVRTDTTSTDLFFTLQTVELVGKAKKVAQQYVQPLRYCWDGKTYRRVQP